MSPSTANSPSRAEKRTPAPVRASSSAACTLSAAAISSAEKPPIEPPLSSPVVPAPATELVNVKPAPAESETETFSAPPSSSSETRPASAGFCANAPFSRFARAAALSPPARAGLDTVSTIEPSLLAKVIETTSPAVTPEGAAAATKKPSRSTLIAVSNPPAKAIPTPTGGSGGVPVVWGVRPSPTASSGVRKMRSPGNEIAAGRPSGSVTERPTESPAYVVSPVSRFKSKGACWSLPPAKTCRPLCAVLPIATRCRWSPRISSPILARVPAFSVVLEACVARTSAR